MILKDISQTRLNSQRVGHKEFKTAGEVLKWMGAIQAQDATMSKWAIGTRLIDPLKKDIDKAINNGDILRTHLLRPTWHFVGADDIHWMLDLSAPKILTSLKSRHKELGMTGPVINKCHKIIENSLADAGALTRQELGDLFNSSGITTEENKLSHILFEAELNQIICSGPLKNEKQTYSLLSERVPEIKRLTRDEALAELASRYFRSRYPATIADFIWWSNLSTSDARKAVDYLKSDFSVETIGDSDYYIPLSLNDNGKFDNSVLLLPAFDEFLISYKDRKCSLSQVHNRKAVSDNGIFYPIIVYKGQVTGTWKRNIKKNGVTITTSFFNRADNRLLQLLEKKVRLYGEFLELKVEWEYKTE
jgi:hypothetical protein